VCFNIRVIVFGNYVPISHAHGFLILQLYREVGLRKRIIHQRGPVAVADGSVGGSAFVLRLNLSSHAVRRRVEPTTKPLLYTPPPRPCRRC